ncbi:hypothetical protein SDC9_105208 [bioreactor metagenome]|uniref:Uncharacterized protein n=1 Tax=bioreactor metagenome TaxID=1076179 RepID=A0A645AYY3_9ZZZZ
MIGPGTQKLLLKVLKVLFCSKESALGLLHLLFRYCTLFEQLLFPVILQFCNLELILGNLHPVL